MKMRMAALLVALLAITSVATAQTVTVHSDGVTGDYATLGAALTAVQANSAGPDIITILDEGPFLESAQLAMTGDSNESTFTLQASAGIRPRVCVEYNGDGAILIQRNGIVTIKDLILMPQVGVSTTRSQGAIKIDDPASDIEFNITLSNLLICPNNGSNQPAASADGTSVTLTGATTFRDEGILLQSMTNFGVHKLYMDNVVVSGLFGDQGSDGVRGFIDGATGSEWIIGEGCVVSNCQLPGFSPSTSGLGAIQPGGNLGDIPIKIQGTEANPVKLFNNGLSGIFVTGANSPGLNSIEWAIIANNYGPGFSSSDAGTTVTFENVTFVNNGLVAGGAEVINASDSLAAVYTASNCIFAGNGTDGNNQIIDVSTTAAGGMIIADSAIVLSGPYRLDTSVFDGDGFDDNTPSNVVLTNVTNLDSEVYTLDPLSANFAAIRAPAYVVAGPAGGILQGGSDYNPRQNVTVHSSGAPNGDFANIGDALTFVNAFANEDADIITLLDEGPFLESRIIINGDANDSTFTLTATPGLRPRVCVDANADGAIYIRKNNPTTVTDIILMPQVGDPATRPQSAINIDDESGDDQGYTVVLDNILVCPNDGFNQPAAALDGTTVTLAGTTTFRDEGVYLGSNTTAGVHKIYLTDVIVCGLDGDQGSEGIRGFMDGAAGSEWVIGEGCMVSYCNLAASLLTKGAFQPGGNAGSVYVKIQGSELKPVKLVNNNLNGISVTGSDPDSGLQSVEWLIIANNTGAGYLGMDSDQAVSFKNVTIANNGAEAINASDALTGAYTASNCIFAGAGINGTNMVIDVSTSGAGTFAISDSAIVLSGDYKLDTANFDLDGLDDNTPTSNVTLTNVITADPQFVSLDILSGDFGALMNSAYSAAGPGGSELVGGGRYAGTANSILDWELLQ